MVPGILRNLRLSYGNGILAILKPFHMLTGILSVIIGIVIILNPFESTRLIVILIGIYVIAYGLFSIINTRKSYS